MSSFSGWQQLQGSMRLRSVFFVVVTGLNSIAAQAPKVPLKPTESVVKQYEELILRGALLTSQGWKHASELFTAADPYPTGGEITVTWTGTSTLGEEWNDGSRAQVNTKWNEYYGKIDSALRFTADSLGTLPELESFTLVFLPEKSNGANSPNDAPGPRPAACQSRQHSVRY